MGPEMPAGWEAHATPAQAEKINAWLHHGSTRKAGAALGTDHTNIIQARKRVLANMAKGSVTVAEKGPIATLDDLPSDGRPVEEIIALKKQTFNRKYENWRKQHWQPVKFNSDEPMGLMWFGDPHLDDDGCHWPLLERHIEISKRPGIMAANIGDTTNNWVGRLIKKYADQETTRTQGWELCNWFLNDAGIPWLFWIYGNHDAWNDGFEIMKRMNVDRVPMRDWQATLEFQFPNGWNPRVMAAHHFKGNSQFHPLHGGMKKGGRNLANLYISGHTHEWALFETESEDTHERYWVAKARGYKFMDDYALHSGFGCQLMGSSILSVFDPSQQALRCFSDVEEGADYLQWLRTKPRTSLSVKPGQ